MLPPPRPQYNDIFVKARFLDPTVKLSLFHGLKASYPYGFPSLWHRSISMNSTRLFAASVGWTKCITDPIARLADQTGRGELTHSTSPKESPDYHLSMHLRLVLTQSAVQSDEDELLNTTPR